MNSKKRKRNVLEEKKKQAIGLLAEHESSRKKKKTGNELTVKNDSLSHIEKAFKLGIEPCKLKGYFIYSRPTTYYDELI